MSGPGVFAVARDIFADPDFADEPFTEREAWLWLIASAAWKPHLRRGSIGKMIMLERGEFSFSIRFLAEAWGWQKDRTHRFMKKIRNRDSIRDTSRDSSTVYLIKNYSKFQVVGLPDRDSISDNPRAQDATATRQTRNIKSSFPNGKGADAPADDEQPKIEIDIRTRLFREGLDTLVAITGQPLSRCRPVIGRWLKANGDDAKKVLRAIEDARDERAADPIAWIEAALKQRRGAAEPATNSLEFAFARH